MSSERSIDPTIRQAIGSLIMTGFRGASLDDPQCRDDVRVMKEAHVKGVILFDRHLPSGGMRNIVSESQLRQLTDDLRNELGDDLIVAIDQEGGSVNRLGLFQDAAVSSMLSAKMQGAMSERQLVATITPVARAMSDAGINLTFAPCVDLAINPDNPIIAQRDRSLGTGPERVARAAATIISTYHDHGVRCCIKHFPGHGSSTIDTHAGIADITSTHSDQETRVFRILIDAMNTDRLSACAVMTGHLFDGSIDPDLPASLSQMHTTEILRTKLGFESAIITDSLDMGAIRTRHDPGTATVQSILAGADIALDGFNGKITPSCPEREHPAAVMHAAILSAVEDGLLEESGIRASIARVQRWMR